MTRLWLIFTIFWLIACGKKPDSALPVCVEDPIPFEFHYQGDPLGITHKTARTVCANGCTTFKTLDASNLTEEWCR